MLEKGKEKLAMKNSGPGTGDMDSGLCATPPQNAVEQHGASKGQWPLIKLMIILLELG